MSYNDLSYEVLYNAVPVVQNKASKVPNDAYVMIDNDLHESDVTPVSHTHQNTVGTSGTEENLKKDFNQKENKYLEEFLDLKALKDKLLAIRTPLCLHRARQVQLALYSGHVIVTPNHAPAVVHDGEETLELTEISKKKMHEKMKANECVDNKVNITLPNYSKKLTLEQIFWSQDIVKMKAEALKEQNTRPIKALTVYPPNTPATLVPRVLPTKSQVKNNIFTLRQ
ncbi:hypothetical protein Tco_0125271, partial [Tanacetum coccineum]